MKRVLLIGGYGGFGARVAILLGKAGFEVVVAGRDRSKASAFCNRHPEFGFRPYALDRSCDIASAIADTSPWLVVDAAGPFQGSDFGVPRACINAGCHYLDLADARDFVAGIAALDVQARAAEVALISGASSVPALSTAVVDRMAAGMDRVSEIDMALSASNRASGGPSITRAILSYVGRPIRLWRGQAWRTGHGWQEMGRVRFAVSGRPALNRSVALCDVPDLELLPDRYPGRPAVRFRAGTELAVQNLGLWLLSWPVRWGWISSIAPLAGLGVRFQELLGQFGGDRSAMRVVVSGWRGLTPIRREWTVLAERGDGPWIPCLAVPLLAQRLARDEVPFGARSAAGSLRLEQFERAFEDFAITTTSEETSRSPLYARLLTDDFNLLPDTLQAMHRVNGDFAAKGMANVTRGSSLLARLISRAIGFPPSADAVPVSVWMRERAGKEVWLRNFGGICFSSEVSQAGPDVVERFGPIRFAMRLTRVPEGLTQPFSRWWIGPIPMTRFLLPRGVAREYESEGRFHFDVPITLPLVGLLIHYRGWLVPLPWSDSGPSELTRCVPSPQAAGTSCRPA